MAVRYFGVEKNGCTDELRIRVYSDLLLVTLLKGKRPDTYRERFEHTGENGQPLMPPVSSLSDAGRACSLRPRGVT